MQRTDELSDRTRSFALRVIRLVQSLPQNSVGWELGRQLLRAGTSIAANYRASRRARSRKEWYSKICVVVEEADETEFWLALIRDSNLVDASRLADLHGEADELRRIFSVMRRNARRKKRPD